ncbi:MAG TPA: DUF4394 domain-containing protein [Tepidisphaeraceae bacterium]|jgi:hypothetical protein
MTHRRLVAVAALAVCFLASVAKAGIIYALDNSNNVFSFDHAQPQNILAGHSISGLAAGEQMLNIDIDPRTTQMIGLSNRSRLYSVDVSTGAATPITPAFTPPLNGIAFGFDVNPAVASQARVVSATDQNLRLDNFATNVFVASGILFGAGDANSSKNANVEALAFANNVASATTSTAFGIDTVQDALVRLGSVNGSPNATDSGQVVTVGALGVDAGNLVGMDISRDGVAFAAITTPASVFSNLYTINLNSGVATPQGRIIGGVTIRDIAADSSTNFAIPEPGTLACLALLPLAFRRVRSRRAGA